MVINSSINTANDTRCRPLCLSRVSWQPTHKGKTFKYKSLVISRSRGYFSDINAPLQGLYLLAAGGSLRDGHQAALFFGSQKPVKC